MKTIILHIGTHKTGTTAFQQYVRRNNVELTDFGIYVPPPGQLHCREGTFPLGSNVGGLHAIPKSLENGRVDLIRAYLCAFEESGLETAVLSSEGFDRFTKEHITLLVNQLQGYKIRIIIALRHPIELARSAFCSRGAIGAANPDKFIMRQVGRRLFAYPELIVDWSHIGSIEVLEFERQDDMTMRLLRSSGAEDLPIRVGAPPRLRESLPVAAAVWNRELYRLTNMSAEKFRSAVYDPLLRFIDSEEYAQGGPIAKSEKLSPFSEKARRQFIKT